MSMRLLLTAATISIATAAVAAEPAKPESRPAATATAHPAAIILASADPVASPTPATPGQASAPVKRPRAARVTSCRCGGQTADPSEDRSSQD